MGNVCYLLSCIFLNIPSYIFIHYFQLVLSSFALSFSHVRNPKIVNYRGPFLPWETLEAESHVLKLLKGTATWEPTGQDVERGLPEYEDRIEEIRRQCQQQDRAQKDLADMGQKASQSTAPSKRTFCVTCCVSLAFMDVGTRDDGVGSQLPVHQSFDVT